MSNRSYSGKQIFKAVRSVEDGKQCVDVASNMGCAVGSVRLWVRKYAGYSEAEIGAERQRGSQIEELRRAANRSASERIAWREVMKMLKLPLTKRLRLFAHLMSLGLVSTNQAKYLLRMANPRTTLVKYERDDAVIADAMRKHFAEYPGHGFSTMFHQILKNRLCGSIRAQRIYTAENLQLFVRNRKRKAATGSTTCAKACLPRAMKPNDTWSIDFMHLRLRNGAPLRSLNVVDDFSRECLLIRGSHTVSSGAVVDQLNALIAWRGIPSSIRCDNGPEFKGLAFRDWASSLGIKIKFTEPHHSYQNGYIERFNRTFRHDVLRWDTFFSLHHFDETAEAYRKSYNNVRPHMGLNWQTPASYAASAKN